MRIGKQLLTNIFSSWSAHAVRIVIAFFFVPFITSVFGDVRYGVWVIIFQSINYFLLLDLGLTSALTRYVSRHLAKDEKSTIGRIIASAGFIYLILGSLVIISVTVFSIYFFDNFQIGDPALVLEGKTALIILGLYFGLSFYLLPYGNSLGAFHRYDLVNLMNVIEEIIRVSLWIYLISEGYGLVAMASVILFLALTKHLIGIIILCRLHPGLRYSPRSIDPDWCKKLFNYSRITFGISICWIMIHHSDSLLLGLISSSAAAGIYYPGAQLIAHFRNIINAVATPLLPVISHLESHENLDEIRQLYLKLLAYVSYASFTFAVGILIFAPTFIKLWLPPEFAQAADVMIILSISAAFFLPQIVGNSVLYGIEKHNYIFRVLLIEIFVKIVLAVILVPRIGMIGMAIASAIPQLVLYTTFYPILISRAIKLSAREILMTSLKEGLLAALIAYPVSWIAFKLIPPDNWLSFSVDIGIVLLVILSAGYIWVLKSEDRQRIISWISRS